MTFPDKHFGDIGSYADAYYDRLALAAASIDRGALAGAVRILREALERDAQIFSCGNGGSASISNHLLCDFAKGIQTDTAFRPRVVSLASNVEMLTAIANDISYDDVFAYQLATQARKGDVLVTISSSGDSENVIRALKHARENDIPTIAMTGFSGGRSRVNADVHIHVTGDNYGVVEDTHQSIMHLLAQYLRLTAMPRDAIANRKF
jgi:phosphoheptose isomerase